MELTLTVHLPRRRARQVDVVVEWAGRHTAAELCAALSRHLGEPVPGLTCGGRPVDPSGLVGMPPLLRGASVVVTTAGARSVLDPPRVGVLDLVVVGGPDAGRSHPLVPPGFAVGRAPGDGFVVADEALSRVHAVFRVGPTGVTVEDVGSTNGVLVDGSRVGEGVTVVDTASIIVMGASTLRLRRSAGPGPPLGKPGDGTIVLRPSAGRGRAIGSADVECPPAPVERPRARLPWVGAVAPVPVAVALAVFLGPQLLLFALLGPFMLLATAVGDRWGSGRTHRRELAAHAAAVTSARARLEVALAEESARLHQDHPDPHALLRMAEQRLPGLWVGGPGVNLRLGLGDVSTRVTWVEGSTRTRPRASRVPVVVDLAEAGCVAVVGSPAVTERLLAALVGRLCTVHPPHGLSVAVDGHHPSWGWVGRMPHAASLASVLAEDGGAAGPGGIEGRSRAGRTTAGQRVLVVPHGDARGRALAARAIDAGVLVLLGVTHQGHVPAGCGTVLARGDGDDRHVLHTADGQVAVTVDLVGAWWTDRVSRALAPLRIRGGTAGGELPSDVGLAEVLGVDVITEEYVLRQWRHSLAPPPDRAPRSPAAVVGLRSEGAFSLDLSRDGPHVLVGGTTGSGKSEFLRTLVTSLALSCPPEDLTFVLVDFKGGAAFGSCADLPHVVGLVTDLDEHLVSRALTSLGAELRRRERLFAAAGARDLEDYRRLAGPGREPVPRLVVVIDELRALVDEVPEFVSGMVRLAALGRSLGVHLVLATQRPAGAVTAEIQANVNLRIAFRVRDRADSVDILEDPSAAGIGSGTPGRALSRGGDGELVRFQAATITKAVHRETDQLWVRHPGAPGAPRRAEEAGPRDATAVVEVIRSAHRRTRGAPLRSPWLPPLPARLAWAPASSQSGGEGVPGVEVGVVDEPDVQRTSPLRWSPEDGTWLLVGRARSGRTTALRSLVLSAASRQGPGHLHVHVVERSTVLADLEQLPHLGTRVGAEDGRALVSLVAHLRDEVDRRRAVAPGSDAARGWPTVLVVVDGWEQLVEAQPATDPDGLVARLMGAFRDGRSVGVVGAVSGGRSLLQPRWSAAAGRTFLLGAVDPLDAALTGLRAADLPREPPPGRAIRVHDRREVQFMVATTVDVEHVAADAGRRPDRGGAWRLRALPTVVRRHQVGAPGTGVEAGGADEGLLLGLAGSSSAVCSWNHDELGRRMIVAGPPGSGRTNVLRAMAESASATGRVVVVVTDSPTDAQERGAFGDARVLGPHDIDSLVELRRRHPQLVLLVDDADRLDDAAVLPALREAVDLVDRDKGLAAVTTTSTALSTRFRGLDVDVARHRTGILLNPGPHDAELLGVRRLHDLPRVPGRGVVVSRGQATDIQVFLAEGSAGPGAVGRTRGIGPGRVGPRDDLGVVLAGDPGGDAGHDGHRDHEPPDHGAVALHQPDPDREQQHAPHDGGRPRPRALPEPAPREQGQPDGPDEDEQGGHEHPGGVAPLTHHELVDVERREPRERHRLHAREQGGEPPGAA